MTKVICAGDCERMNNEESLKRFKEYCESRDARNVEYVTSEPQFIDEPIKPVMRRWMCAKGCGGEMKFNGLVQPMSHPRYEHTCDKCGCRAIAKKVYPGVEYI